MNRYLLNISYIGSSFRGLQRTTTNLHDIVTLKSTIQGAIELGLHKLRPINDIQLCLSSRTDTGVHALHSTVHVDLCRQNGKLYHELAITTVLNQFFNREKLPIRIISVEHVPDTFHVRHNAKLRTYCYRIATSNGRDGPIELKTYPIVHTNYIPVEEFNRCLFIQDTNFDVEKARLVANLFKGVHDFRTFMAKSKQLETRDHPSFTRRSIEDISIKPANATTLSFSRDIAESKYNYWNIEIVGRSFLYKQVRRMVGVILAVASGKLQMRDAYEMLTIPSSSSWCSRVSSAPAYALYLVKVHYNEADKKFPES